MRPGHIAVVADHHDRYAQKRNAAHVELARQRELRLIEAVRSLPEPVRIAEQHALPAARHARAESERVAAGIAYAARLQVRIAELVAKVRNALRRRLPELHGGRMSVGERLDEARVAAHEIRGGKTSTDVGLGEVAHP